MFSFATDYYLFTFAATVGAIQIAASIGRLYGLLFVPSLTAARLLGTALTLGSILWFFGSADRNINDTAGGLDANAQAVLFLLGALPALALTLIASSLTNFRMAPAPGPATDGLDALRSSGYFRALAASLRAGRSWSRDWNLGRLGLTFAAGGVALAGLAFVWTSGSAGALPSLNWLTGSAPVTGLLDIDESILLWVNRWTGTAVWLDSVIELLVSDYMVAVSMALVLVGLWFTGKDAGERNRHQEGILAALAAMALSSWSVYAINGVYQRPRPFVDNDIAVLFYYPTDPSFPSNSAAATFALAAAVWVVNRKVGTVMLAAAVALGFSRVYAGVHYPLDVLAGCGIGVVIALLVHRLRALLEPLPSLALRAARVLCLA